MSGLGLVGKVAVLMGGESSERPVSIKSGEAVLKALIVSGVDAIGLDVPFSDLHDALKKHDIKHCFNILHGGSGENGQVRALLNSMEISCTGSDVLGCAIAMDKQRTKMLWSGCGVPTAPYMQVFNDTEWSDVLSTVGAKFMMKPSNEGSSIGMSVVDSEQSFSEAKALAFKYDNDVIVEKWIDGDEYTVAILGDKTLPMIKLETDNTFYDYEAKYESNETRYICPCGLNEDKEHEVRQMAYKAFTSLGCSGWGRVDVMTDSSGDFYFLEVNTVPGMTDHSLVPMAAKAAGVDFDNLVTAILEASLSC